MRSTRQGFPSRVVTIIFELKITRAVGRANFENISPLAIAMPSKPMKASKVTRVLPMKPFGAITP